MPSWPGEVIQKSRGICVGWRIIRVRGDSFTPISIHDFQSNFSPFFTGRTRFSCSCSAYHRAAPRTRTP